MDTLLQDLRYGFRILARAPGFTVAAVVTLALGIGANTAIFSIIDGVLLSPFPYPDPDHVVSIWNRYGDKERATLAEPEFEAYRDRSNSFQAMAAFYPTEGNLTGRGEPTRVNAVVASSGIFDTLGVQPHVGRFYSAAEDLPGAGAVVVISYETWSALGADPELVGDKLMLDGAPFTVLGVMPPNTRMPHDYSFGTTTDVWLPLQLDPAEEGDWGMHGLAGLGRLEDDVTLERAQLDMDRVVAQLKKEHVGSRDAVGYDSFGVVLLDLPSEVVGSFSTALVVLLGAVACVLLIACANVANLLLARAAARRRELALRNALGAARPRLLRQLFTESLLLALAGGVMGVVLAHWLITGIVALDPGNIPRLGEIQLDGTVLGFSLVLTLLAGLGFGLLPALTSSRVNLWESLRSGGRTSGAGLSARGLRPVVTVVEIAVAVVLIVGAGLLIRSLANMQAADPGFRTDHLLTLRIEVPASAYPDQNSVASFYNRLEERLQALPGVLASGGVTGLPLASQRGDWNFYPEGRVVEEGVSSPRGDWQLVTPGYFEALGVQVISGRTYTSSDGPDTPLGIVFNQSLAERYYPNEDPVGQRVRLGGKDDNPWITVLGVVSDVRHRGLDMEPRPEWYLSHAQAGPAMGLPPRRGFDLAIRTVRPPEQLVPEVRSVIAELDPNLPLANLRTMDEIRALSLAQPRFATAFLTSFAALAVVLGSIGIFGVISHLVAQRSREIAVRMALGARRSQVIRMVLGEGMRLTGLGLGLGVAAALALTQVLQSQLHEVSPTDPLTFVATLVVLFAVATCASLLPAGRAARVEPVRLLRED